MVRNYLFAEAGLSDRLYYHTNAHGDVTAITDEGGDIIASFSYDPWGVPTEYDSDGNIAQIGSWAGTPGDGLFYLFGGMLYDALAGIYLTKTRAYDPKRGRFLERDLLDEDQKGGYRGFPFGANAIGSNLYGWCKNNPTNMVDPSGEWGLFSLFRSFKRVVRSFVRNFVPIVRRVVSYARSWGRRYARPAVQAASRIATVAVTAAVRVVKTVVKALASTRIIKPVSTPTAAVMYKPSNHNTHYYNTETPAGFSPIDKLVEIVVKKVVKTGAKKLLNKEFDMEFYPDILWDTPATGCGPCEYTQACQEWQHDYRDAYGHDPFVRPSGSSH